MIRRTVSADFMQSRIQNSDKDSNSFDRFCILHSQF